MRRMYYAHTDDEDDEPEGNGHGTEGARELLDALTLRPCASSRDGEELDEGCRKCIVKVSIRVLNTR